MKTPQKRNKQIPPVYFNRELSWLAFNRRVLNLCTQSDFPLLEKLRFLSIACNNLDEFFEIRVAGLEQQLESNVPDAGFDGMGVREQLSKISDITSAFVKDSHDCWTNSLLPALKKEKIFFKRPQDCSAQERAWLKKYYDERIFPALTPMLIDPAHPFPHLRNKGLYVLLSIADASAPRAKSETAIVAIPPIMPRLIKIESQREGLVFAYLGDTIKYFAQSLFDGFKVRNAAIFRVTRNSDLYFDEEETENLLQTIERELLNRRKGAAVRLEIEDCVSDPALKKLVSALDLDGNFVFKTPASPLNLARLGKAFDAIDRPDLKFAPFKPHKCAFLDGYQNIFEAIKIKDILLQHPYDSFQYVENFISQAATDPSVLAIKLTLYRTDKHSPILAALKEAAKNGKQVTLLIELKARFDEENNIQWARELEEAGAHVVYGIVGLKTHCKVCMVVRSEPDGTLRRYAHIGTGNYNSITAKIYTDLSFLTADVDICAEVANLFNTLTGKSKSPKFENLIVAPFSFHDKFVELVDGEIENAKHGKPARIVIKVNSIVEKDSIDALYRASKADVKVELVVRGICALVPDVKGLSENISVRSIVGKYLEHSRIYYFENGGEPLIYAGSGDLMTRNMFKRIECLFPVRAPDLKARIIDILNALLRDNTFATLLHANGAYYASPEMKSLPPFSAQHYFEQGRSPCTSDFSEVGL